MAKDEKEEKEEKKGAKKEGPKKNSDDDGEEKEAGGSKKKLIIIGAAVAVLLLAGGGAGLYFSGMLGGGETPEKGEKAAAEGEPVLDKDGKPIIPGQPVFYDLPEFLVNLNTGGKQTSFLKMRVSLDLPSQEALKAVEANVPRIQDDFNTYLRELRASDLSGSAGIYRLKEELLLRVNKAIYPQKVNDILFKEILVQ